MTIEIVRSIDESSGISEANTIDGRTCREISESPDYARRIAEEHRLMEERLDQRANGHSNGHEPNGSGSHPYFASGIYTSQAEQFAARFLYGSPEGKVVIPDLSGLNLKGSGKKENTKE